MVNVRRIRYKLGALLLGVVISVAVMEIVLRMLGLGFGSSPMEPDSFLDHVHPRNYSFRQLHPSRELGGFDTYYNAEGRVFSGHETERASPAPPCRIAIMGDSFTEGGQVPFEESWAGRLDAAARGTCDVRNYGVRSYSPAIYLVQWTREVRLWKPTHAFVLLFGNDVREDINYLRAADIDSNGWPTAIHGPSGDWFFSQLRRFYVARFGRMVYTQIAWAWEHYGEEQWTIGGVVEENPEWPGKTAGLVAELNNRVRADGAQLVVMAVPSRYRLMGDGKIKVVGDFHQSAKAWAEASRVSFLDLYSPFERASRTGIPLFFLQDIHFNGEGHTLTSAAIARAFPQLFTHWREISSPSVRAAFAAEGQ